MTAKPKPISSIKASQEKVRETIENYMIRKLGLKSTKVFGLCFCAGLRKFVNPDLFVHHGIFMIIPQNAPFSRQLIFSIFSSHQSISQELDRV